MKKQEIINFLSCTYCRIKTSKIHGVGVHAIMPIKKGTNLFPDCSVDLNKIIKINKKEVDHLHENVKQMMGDFLIESETHYFTPTSLNKIDISYFLNHSNTPNCEWVESDDSFRNLIDLDEGDELPLDYEKYLNSELVKNYYEEEN